MNDKKKKPEDEPVDLNDRIVTAGCDSDKESLKNKNKRKDKE
jgi:hypothetical protein